MEDGERKISIFLEKEYSVIAESHKKYSSREEYSYYIPNQETDYSCYHYEIG